MSDVYCGVMKPPKGKRIGTPNECLNLNQVRYYGINQVDKALLLNKTTQSKERKRMKLLDINISKIMGRIKKLKDDLKYSKNDDVKKELRKVIKEQRDQGKKDTQELKKLKAKYEPDSDTENEPTTNEEEEEKRERIKNILDSYHEESQGVVLLNKVPVGIKKRVQRLIDGYRYLTGITLPSITEIRRESDKVVKRMEDEDRKKYKYIQPSDDKVQISRLPYRKKQKGTILD